MASNNLAAVKSALDTLGFDIIVQIVSFLDPKEIVVLRRVCRALLTASHERIVWMNALHMVSERHGIYTGTFPKRKMTMTTAQLQHAATSPAQFMAYLQRELGPPKNKLPTELMKSKSIRNLPGGRCFERAFLVPGGRYILTMSSYRNAIIKLWDIGFSRYSVTPPGLVTSRDFRGNTITILGLQPIGIGGGLLVMLEVEPHNSDIEYFRALEVYPSTPIPTFNLVGSLSFEEESLPVCFVGDTFVFISNGNATVWNPIQDSWARWRIDIEGETLNDLQCLRCNDLLLFMSDNELTVWKIPPLVDRSINPDPPFECIAPLLRQIHREPTKHSGSFLVPQIGWKHTMSSRMHYDILYRQNTGKTALSHHILHTVDDGVDEGSPTLIFTGQTPSVTPSYEAAAFVKSAWMSPTEAVYFWAENFKVVAVLSTQAPSKNRCSVGILWESGSEREPDAEVCPFSGCVCLLNRRKKNGRGFVQIIDYI